MKQETEKSETGHSNYDAEKIWSTSWTYIRTVIDTLHEPFLILDADLKILSGNRRFYTFFKVDEKETEGKKVYELGNGQWDIPNLRKLLEEILPENTFFWDYHVDHVFPEIGRRILILNARRIHRESDQKEIILLAMEDVTKKKELEEMLRDYAGKLNGEVARKTKILEERVLELEHLIKNMKEKGIAK